MKESSQYLFVYGTLLYEDNPYAAFLKENGRLYQTSKFKGRLFNIGNYPGAIFSPNAHTFVYGSVFYIDDPKTVLKELDDYEGFGDNFLHPNEFVRELVEVETRDTVLKCWVYLYNLPVKGLRQITSGDYLKQ